MYFQGKHAKANAGDTSTIEEGEMDPSLGTIDRKAQKAKDALNAAGNVLHNPDAIDEVKEEWSRSTVLGSNVHAHIESLLLQEPRRYFQKTPGEHSTHCRARRAPGSTMGPDESLSW